MSPYQKHHCKYTTNNFIFNQINFYFFSSDDLTTMIAMYLKENPWLWQVGIATFGLGLLISLISSLKSTKKPEPKKKK